MESTRIFCMIRVIDESFVFFAPMYIPCYNEINQLTSFSENIQCLRVHSGNIDAHQVWESTPFFFMSRAIIQRLYFSATVSQSCYNRMRKSLHLRSLHLVTQTIKLIDDLADQILIPVAALEEVMVNDSPHTGFRVTLQGAAG